MKKIVLHGPATDGAGRYCDSGTELDVVADKPKAGQIAADRARELVDEGRAVSATAEARSNAEPRKPAARRKTARKPKKTTAPAAKPAPTPAPPAVPAPPASPAPEGRGESQ